MSNTTVSRGESKTRWMAMVSSTTPRFGPRCPPVRETSSTRKRRISSARAGIWSGRRDRRSSGPSMRSSRLTGAYLPGRVRRTKPSESRRSGGPSATPHLGRSPPTSTDISTLCGYVAAHEHRARRRGGRRRLHGHRGTVRCTWCRPVGDVVVADPAAVRQRLHTRVVPRDEPDFWQATYASCTAVERLVAVGVAGAGPGPRVDRGGAGDLAGGTYLAGGAALNPVVDGVEASPSR